MSIKIGITVMLINQLWDTIQFRTHRDGIINFFTFYQLIIQIYQINHAQKNKTCRMDTMIQKYFNYSNPWHFFQKFNAIKKTYFFSDWDEKVVLSYYARMDNFYQNIPLLINFPTFNNMIINLKISKSIICLIMIPQI